MVRLIISFIAASFIVLPWVAEANPIPIIVNDRRDLSYTDADLHAREAEIALFPRKYLEELYERNTVDPEIEVRSPGGLIRTASFVFKNAGKAADAAQRTSDTIDQTQQVASTVQQVVSSVKNQVRKHRFWRRELFDGIKEILERDLDYDELLDRDYNDDLD
jgi:hypothetical protein